MNSMNAQHQLRDKLQSLSIPRDQRPQSAGGGDRTRTRSGGGTAWIIALVIAGLGGTFAWNQYGGRIRPLLAEILSSPGSANPKPRLMTVTTQRASEIGAVQTATGKIVSDHEVDVATKVSGQVVELKFEQGDRVEKNQVLARIEDVIYRARRDSAAAMLEKSRASHEYQKFNYQRVKRLFETNQASETEVNDTVRWYNEAKAQMDADAAALALAEKQFRDCEVLAPISGVVLERSVEVGDFVAAEGGRGAMANSQFGVIADMSKLRVEVDISELDIHRIQRGMPCSIIPDAQKDRRYTGQVMWVDPGANYAKATVQVKVRVNDPDDALRVQGTAQVQFLREASSAGDSKPMIFIPLAAVIASADGASGKVYVKSEGKLRERTVHLGARTATNVEITEGLSDGDMIAAEGIDKLRDGDAAE
ncbi:MAG: efflux RND transporter periplasmic adaptor subunit [Phycisphaerales bacterium]|nr:efflux RND transporter periplasmic adaptor subunit [Phycisphaerales bacterium]